MRKVLYYKPTLNAENFVDNLRKKFWHQGYGTVFLHSQKTDLVAQLVEHNTFNVGALGSSPSGVTGSEKSELFLFDEL